MRNIFITNLPNCFILNSFSLLSFSLSHWFSPSLSLPLWFSFSPSLILFLSLIDSLSLLSFLIGSFKYFLLKWMHIWHDKIALQTCSLFTDNVLMCKNHWLYFLWHEYCIVQLSAPHLSNRFAHRSFFALLSTPDTCCFSLCSVYLGDNDVSTQNTCGP